MEWSSEAHKAGIVPKKKPEEMTKEELKEFRNSFDPDSMGFDGHEVGDDN